MKITKDILKKGHFTKKGNFCFNGRSYSIKECKNCENLFFSRGTVFCSRGCSKTGDYASVKTKYIKEKISQSVKKAWTDGVYCNRKNNTRKGKAHPKYKGYPSKKIHKKICKECKNEFLGSIKQKFCNQSCANRYTTRNRMLNGYAVYLRSLLKTISKPQKKIYNIVHFLGFKAELEYPILNFSIDIAIPALNIAIEYDGSYWHQNKKKDKLRQQKIEEQGWSFIRYVDKIPSKENVEHDIKGILDYE